MPDARRSCAVLTCLVESAKARCACREAMLDPIVIGMDPPRVSIQMKLSGLPVGRNSGDNQRLCFFQHYALNLSLDGSINTGLVISTSIVFLVKQHHIMEYNCLASKQTTRQRESNP